MIRCTGAENSQGCPQILGTSCGGTDAWPRLREPCLACTQAPQNLARALQNRSHLLPLDVALDLGDFDLQGIQFLIWHQRDVGDGLQFIHHLEVEVRERNVPFAVILLGFAGVERDESVNRPSTSLCF